MRDVVSAIALFFAFAYANVAQAELIVGENFDDTSTWINDFDAQQFVDPNSPFQGLFVGDNSGIGGANIGAGNTAFGRDLLGELGEPSLSPYTFTFNDVDTSAFKDIVLSFDAYAFANIDAGSYEIIVDGVGLGAVEWYNDPDEIAEVLNFSESIGTAGTIGLVLSGTLSGTNDILEFDNFELNGVLNGVAVPEPSAAVVLSFLAVGMIYHRRKSAQQDTTNPGSSDSTESCLLRTSPTSS